MPLLKLEIDVTEATLQQIDQLRGSYERTSFLARCIELGLTDYADEASRVYREALYMNMLNRTQDYSESREQRGVNIRDAQPELNLRASSGHPASAAHNFQGSSRRVTAA